MKNARKVYMFDLEGNLIQTFDTCRIAEQQLGIPEANINSYILRKTCIHQSFYLSRQREFEIPIRKTNFNPLYKGYWMKYDTIEREIV